MKLSILKTLSRPVCTLSCFRFIRLPVVVIGNKTVAEDKMANGEKKAAAVAEVELADVEEAPADD